MLLSVTRKCCVYSTYYSKSIGSRGLKVLGIETSCDDTGCAVIDSKRNILGEALYSQNVVHLRYGGINPVIARELHRDNIETAVSETLRKSSLTVDDIDAVAVTVKPGLTPSLLIGVKYAKYIAKKYKKPLVPIHHMKAHAIVARMFHNIQFPYLVLLISGGHCLLSVAKDLDDFLLLGQSLDDSPGEAFDKTARRMKLRNIPQYSEVTGGRAIELAASKAVDPDMFQFPIPLVRYRDCNFSFSGLKESVVRKLKRKELEHGVIADGVIPEINDLCASFQKAVTKHLIHRTERAIQFCDKTKLISNDRRLLVVSGGVACNNFIFHSLSSFGSKLGYQVLRPPPKVCTDNGIMIAWNGLEKLQQGQNFTSTFDLCDIQAKCPIGFDMISEVKKFNLPVRITRLKSIL